MAHCTYYSLFLWYVSDTIAASKRSQRTKLTSDLKSATLFTQVLLFCGVLTLLCLLSRVTVANGPDCPTTSSAAPQIPISKKQDETGETSNRKAEVVGGAKGREEGECERGSRRKQQDASQE